MRELAEPIGISGHGIAGGVVPAHDQQDEIAHEGHLIHVAHVRMDHAAEQIGRFGRFQPLVPELLEIGAHFIHVHQPLVAAFLGAELLHIARPVGPEGQLAAVFPRKIEQDGKHLRGQLDRDFIDPVKRLADRQIVENFRRAAADILSHPHHFGRGEGRRDHAALLGMFGPVHGDEHRHPDLFFFRDRLRFLADQRDAAFLGGKQIGQRLDMLDRLGGGDVPVISKVRIDDLVDRCLRAHLLEDVLPAVFGIDLRAAHIPVMRGAVHLRFLGRIFGIGGFESGGHGSSPIRRPDRAWPL